MRGQRPVADSRHSQSERAGAGQKNVRLAATSVECVCSVCKDWCVCNGRNAGRKAFKTTALLFMVKIKSQFLFLPCMCVCV